MCAGVYFYLNFSTRIGMKKDRMKQTVGNNEYNPLDSLCSPHLPLFSLAFANPQGTIASTAWLHKVYVFSASRSGAIWKIRLVLRCGELRLSCGGLEEYNEVVGKGLYSSNPLLKAVRLHFRRIGFLCQSPAR